MDMGPHRAHQVTEKHCRILKVLNPAPGIKGGGNMFPLKNSR
jgi:hypothetical protein